MNSKFHDFLEKIKSLDDSQMIQIVTNAEQELNKDFFPQILIVSNSSARKEIIESLGNLIGSTNIVLDYLANEESEYIVRLQYADDWNINGFDDINESIDAVNISIPWVTLQCVNILWAWGSSLKNIPNNLIINSDKILLVTNATMAMTHEEKEWLATLRESIFSDEPVTVTLCNKLAMNTQEEIDDLCASITQKIARYGENTKFDDDFGIALSNLTENINVEHLQSQRKKRILRACFDNLEDYFNIQLRLAEVDIDKLNESIKEIEAVRKNIEFSGKFGLTSTIENMYAEMKNKIISAADRYGDDVYKSIRSRLTVSNTIEKDINNIVPYLKTAWENFEREIGKHMASEQEQIASVLEQQITSDCERMVDNLEVSSFGETMDISTADIIFSHISIGDMDDSKVNKNVMISKGVLFTSIVLAFSNPLWGLVGVGANVYLSNNNKNNLDKAKANVLSALSNECNSIKYGVERKIENVIEKAKKESCDNILKVYSDVLDSLMVVMSGHMDQIKAAKEKASILQSVLNNEILEAKANLK